MGIYRYTHIHTLTHTRWSTDTVRSMLVYTYSYTFLIQFHPRSAAGGSDSSAAPSTGGRPTKGKAGVVNGEGATDKIKVRN